MARGGFVTILELGRRETDVCSRGHTEENGQIRSRMVSVLSSAKLGISIMKTGNVFRPLSGFEVLLTTIGRSKLLSGLLAVLTSNVKTVENYKLKWEQDLQMQWTDEQWWALCRLNQACSRNVVIQENRFKILHRWHLTHRIIER